LGEIMVDSEARKIAAEITRRFVAGQISNFEFENQFPTSKDPAMRAIEDTLWCFYDDFEEHCIKGKWDVPDETKSIMLRWVMFLYSEEEYQWPNIRFPGIRPIQFGLLGKIFNRHKAQHEFLSAGDIEFWPFISSEAYIRARQNPVLLAGI
jgi:hypothetical protein